MKKNIAFLLTVLPLFYTAALFTACASPPPPPPPTPPPAAATPTPMPAVQQPEPGPEPDAAEIPDMSPPEISVNLTPQPYSPVNPDGEEQFLTAVFNVKSPSPIYGWHLEMSAVESDELFLSISQEGDVPQTVTWDGRNLKGEMVESAAIYNYSVTVANAYGSATYNGALSIDVLVQREANGLLRIIVPSIIFAPNSGELFMGVDRATAVNNEKILKRIAEVLGYFGNYKVKVEGHANPISAPNTRQRTIEQTRGLYRGDKGLKPLSEERAKAIVEYLVKLGVDRSRLSYIGMGADRIRASFTDKANWWKNRRVEFILEKP